MAQSVLGGALGKKQSHTHVLEAASLLNFAGDTISRGFRYLWEPPWSWAVSRLLWNLGATQGELWLWDFSCGWPGFCGYLYFKILLIQCTYGEILVKTAGGFASARPYDTIPWATPAHRRGPPESPCGLKKSRSHILNVFILSLA